MRSRVSAVGSTAVIRAHRTTAAGMASGRATSIPAAGSFSSVRPGGTGGDDIYVSFKAREGWDPALNLGQEVNTPGFEDCASVTPDGEYLVWSSRKVEKRATSQIRVIPLHELRVFKGMRAGN